MSGRDVGERGQAQTVERLACGKRLEGDHNVVRTSEFESLVAQTVLLSPVHRWANYIDTIIGTTTLYSNCTIKDSASLPWEFLRKVFYLMGISLYRSGNEFLGDGLGSKYCIQADLGSERLWAISWVGVLERRNCQGRDLAQPGGEGKRQGQGQKQQLSTAAAKCAAFGRNDGGWVMRREQATATAIADFSTAAAKCAAFGRNDDFWVAGLCSTRMRCATIVRYGGCHS